jgi:hypothetical protein
MPEDADVGVGVSTLIERIDEHGCTCGGMATDYKSAWLLEVRFVPWEECH